MLVASVASPATAHPEGAPWGSADPDTLNSCASCHFDHEPVGRSQSLLVAGLPEYAEAGEEYEVTLRLDAGGAAGAGFLLSASTGAFGAINDFVEVNGSEARSVKPSLPRNGFTEWSFIWRAGAQTPDIVTFRAAAIASDNDQSPFGDELHFRKFEVLMRTGED